MKKRIVLVLCLIAVAGCVDTPDSVCLEFRNANNEHIDALMMITSEAQAKRMTIRVLSQMRDRYAALDKKWDIMETNWGNKGPDLDGMKAFLESDGFHLYRAEYRANAQRCSLELARIRNLLEQLTARAKQAAQDAGQNPNDVRPVELFPALDGIVNKPNMIGILRMQLEKPKLEEQMLSRFKGKIDTKKPEGKAMMDIFNAKNEAFNKNDEHRPKITLVD